MPLGRFGDDNRTIDGMNAKPPGEPLAGSLVDRDLERLVEELNTDSPGDEGDPSVMSDELLDEGPSLEEVFANRGSAGDLPLYEVLLEMADRGASDLHLICGLPWAFRIDGDLQAASDSGAASSAELRRLLAPHLGAREREILDSHGAIDFSLSAALPSGRARFRINIHRQRGQLAAAIRLLPARIPNLRDLGLPTDFAELVRPRQGLVLVCGPTGSGKSTTMAALIGEINRSRRAHVITIEDPVEYEHASHGCFVEHVEIGRDSPSFANALRSSLRQDPDVIVVGEVRDLETIATALTAAETGHLILTSVHSSDGVQALHRLLDVFPPGAKSQVRHQLALSLNAVISQRLIPRADGTGRVVAVEKLVATPAVRRLIRDDAVEKIYNEVTLGRRYGMVSMEASLAQLVRQRVVSEEEAKVRSTRPEELASLLRS